MSANLNVMTWKTWPILVKGSLVSIFKTIGILSDSGQDYKVIKREKIGESCFLLLNKATAPTNSASLSFKNNYLDFLKNYPMMLI